MPLPEIEKKDEPKDGVFVSKPIPKKKEEKEDKK